MKSFVICSTLCAVGFGAMGMQMGLFRPAAARSAAADVEGGDNAAPQDVPVKKAVLPKARFPYDLAPAAKAQPVEQAKAYVPSDRAHKMLLMKTNGGMHDWQDSLAGYHPDWCAETVEETELVVVIGGQRKIQVSHHTYPNGAPPVTRYQYHLEASLVVAKTGQVLAHRQFQNRPRVIRDVEAWELTLIGQPVSYQTVFRWASVIAKHGAPATPDIAPIVTIVGD